MAQFSQSRYDIYTHRQSNRDERSPFAPVSPDRKVSPVGEQRTPFEKLAIGAVAFAAAKKVSGSIIQEIGDTTGNQQFVTNVNNALRVGASALLIAKTGPVGAALFAANTITQEVINYRRKQRELVEREYENKLRAARLNVGNYGSVSYYD